EGIRILKLFPEDKPTDDKDSDGNIKPVDIGSPATNPDDGNYKSKLLLEGTLIDPKDLERNTQLAGRGYPFMDTDQSGTDTKYQLLMEDSDDELKELNDDDIFEAIE
nr:hypothetical protein [Tanacetum cinerariifolium]